MAEPLFRLVEICVGKSLRRVRLSGEVDISCANSLASTPVLCGDTSVEVDVTDLGFIDAAGIGALIAARNRLERKGRQFTVTGAQGIIRRVFEIIGFDDWAKAA